MMKHGIFLSALALVALAGCDNDPSKGKVKVEAKEAVAVAEQAIQADAEREVVSYAFSQEGSKVEYVGAKVTGKHEGGFEEFAGTIELVDGDPKKSKVEVVIQTASLFSDAEKLTGHLKSDDFFGVERFPTAKFVSTSIEDGAEGKHSVTGNLTLRDVTKSITFPAEIEVKGDEVEVEAEFAINRKDFGIVYPGMPDDLIKDEVLMKLDIEAKKR